MRRFKMTVTTASDGTATAFSPRVNGKLHSIQYIKDATIPYTDGVDFTVTAETTGESILTESNVNASAVRYPRAPTHSQVGAAALYATGGTPISDKVAVAGDRVKIAIAQGGSAKVGAFQILID
jgi:hypothetical protein